MAAGRCQKIPKIISNVYDLLKFLVRMLITENCYLASVYLAFLLHDNLKSEAIKSI